MAYPAPALIAAVAESVTAPVRPREPPATSTWPEVNLVESGPRRGGSSSTPASISPPAGGAVTPSGIPISATRSSPQWRLPGAIRWPSFAAWKATVTVASTATPATSPVEASTPDGMSAATTGASPALIASIASAAGDRGAPPKPVPKIASTTAPEPASSSPTSPGETSRPGVSSRSRFAFASGDRSAAGQSRSGSTSKPVSARRRAATRPSPPLLPLPHTTRIGPSAATSRTAAATAEPAASIRRREGTPWSEIAQASTARMPSAS